jgi:hypothetical protein
MRSDLTEIVVVLDRSYSMMSCRSAMEEGLNAFVNKQKQESGETRFTLVKFDDFYEIELAGVDIKSVGHCALEPRGNTALLDAVGKTIVDTGARLAVLKEEGRPGLVVIVIVTDGEENSSKEFKLEDVKALTKQQTETYNWQFTYLGANQDAFGVAQGMGLAAAGAANYNVMHAKMAFDAAGSNVSRMRSATREGRSVENEYTAEERKTMEQGE